jgi:two-component system, OmpR family, sensor histidine kinase ChvG
MLKPLISIRTRLLALSVVLLVIPYVGYRYVVEMEGFLRTGFEEALLGGSRALAGALHGRRSLFPEHTNNQPDLYAYPLSSAPQLDGYGQEWGAVGSRRRELEWDKSGQSAPPPTVAMGLHANHLYVLLDVEDNTSQQAVRENPLSGDHIVLRVIDRAAQRHHYLIDTSDSGPVQARELVRDKLGQPGTRRELRIHGVERRSTAGYTLELRVPMALLGGQLALSVTDAQGARGSTTQAGSTQPDAELGALIIPSSDISAIVTALGATPGRRVWVVDKESRVLARGGTLAREAKRSHTPAIFAWILGLPSKVQYEDAGPVDRLDTAEVHNALAGASATRWRATSDRNQFIVSAAHPVWAGDEVIGAVLTEESSAPIQTARSQALTELFIATLGLFLLASVALVLFASSLSRRLRRLLREASTAIDDHGRVVGDVGAGYGSDEIGELAGGVRELLDRLAQYNRYLERLASRLSHELRTPLAVIRSSLDNIEQVADSEDPQFLERARTGVQRLQSLITRMSEVTRIEEAVRNCESGPIALTELMPAVLDGYRDIWPNQTFELVASPNVGEIEGSAELLIQMLDKLVANALDFAAPGTPIEVHLEPTERNVSVRVVNYGSQLPTDMGEKLFESMVSIRPRQSEGDQPHLGLGLHIVRLIAQAHAGTVSADQFEGPDRVSFNVVLPRLE